MWYPSEYIFIAFRERQHFWAYEWEYSLNFIHIPNVNFPPCDKEKGFEWKIKFVESWKVKRANPFVCHKNINRVLAICSQSMKKKHLNKIIRFHLDINEQVSGKKVSRSFSWRSFCMLKVCSNINSTLPSATTLSYKT